MIDFSEYQYRVFVPALHAPFGKRIEEIIDWCNETGISNYFNLGLTQIDETFELFYVFYFAEEKDAAHFKLRWI